MRFSNVWRSATWAAGLLCAFSPIDAQRAPLVDRGLFFDDPAVTDIEISPNGRLFAYRAPFDGQLQLWLSRVHLGVDSAVRVSDGPAEEFFWTRDSESLLFLRDENGDENFHLFAVDADTTGVASPRDLTPIANVRARVYALPDSEPGTVVVGLNDRDPRADDVYRIDIGTGARELVLENVERVSHWVTDLLGVPRIGVRFGEDGGTEILRVRGDTVTPAFGCSPDETCIPLRFHQANRRLYMVTDQGERERTELVLFHPETFEVELVHGDPDESVDISDAIFASGSNLLVATVYRDDTTRIYAQDSVFAIDLDRISRRQPVASLSIDNSSANEALWVLRQESPSSPARYYLYNRWYDSLNTIASERPSLTPAMLAESEWVSYGASDDEEIAALLTLPRSDSTIGLPTVIIPHDGFWSTLNGSFDPMVQFLANRGYAVLQPRYRGPRELGMQLPSAGFMQQDLAEVARYLVERGIADPDRVGIVGSGPGGYSAMAAMAFESWTYAAGVAFGAVADLVAYVADVDENDLLIQPALFQRLGDPELPEERQRLESQSPIRAADSIDRPVLLAHGVNDSRVDVTQTERLVHALRTTGTETEYLRMPDEGDRIRRAPNRNAFAAALERFLADNLGGRHQQAIRQDLADLLADLSVGTDAPLGPEVLALTAPLPSTDATDVEPATFVYRITTGEGDATELTRRLISETVNGQAIWRVIDSTLVPALGGFEFDSTQFMDDGFEFEPELSGEMMPAADTIDIDRMTLLPLRRRTGGMATASVDFSEERVTGEMFVADFVDNIDVQLEAPSFSDGAALDVVIASLDLSEGYETSLRAFDIQLGQVVPFVLRVDGTDQIDTPAGSFDVFSVSLDPVGVRYAEPRALLVRQESPHLVIVSRIEVQNEFGTYEQTTELVSVTGGAGR